MLVVSSQTNRFLALKKLTLWTAVVLLALSLVAPIIMYSRFQLQNASALDCGDIFDPIPTWATDRIATNKSVYAQVSNETGVPWELLAAIHYRELNLAIVNPSNGQGIYQLYSSGQYFTPGPVDHDGFVTQTRLAADFLQNKAQNTSATPIVSARKMTANEADLNLIKSSLYSYNGRASAYADQAATYGFDRTNQPFEGSPYVMNKFDCKRLAMGLITTDGSNSISGTDTRMGAFTLYARLKSDGYWNSLQVGNIPGCAEATNTNISCVWKLYNSGTNKYTYTISYDERNSLIASGFLYQGVAFYGINPAAPNAGNLPVYSLRDSQNGSLLTTDKPEYDSLKLPVNGWRDMGIGFYADPAGSNSGYSVYRLYDPAKRTHILTSDDQERSQLLSNGAVDEGQAFASISTVKRETAAPSGQELVYRFGNMPGNTHFWTRDLNERDSMINAGYHYEGVAWRSTQTRNTTPVYRLYSQTMQLHLYTSDSHEMTVLDATPTWASEGIAWYSNAADSGAAVYRLYSPTSYEHFFTSDAYERSVLIHAKIFRDEGAAWYQP